MNLTIAPDTAPNTLDRGSKNCRISIVIPVFNDQETIARALDSCLYQTFENFEVICVDDGSTDDTPLILAEYAAKDPRVFVVTHDRSRTAFQARRTGVLRARGDYIMFLDGDDEYALTACAVVDMVAQIDSPDVIHFGTTITNTEGARMTSFETSLDPKESVLVGGAIFDYFLGPKRNVLQGHLWNKAYCRRLAVDSFGEQSPSLEIPRINDLCMTFILLARAMSYRSVPDRLYRYRFGAGLAGQRSLDLEGFEIFLKARLAYEIIVDFVSGDGCTVPDPDAALRRLRKSLIRNTTGYLAKVRHSGPAALKRFLETWPSEEVIASLMTDMDTGLAPFLEGWQGIKRDPIQKARTIGIFGNAIVGHGGIQRVIALQAKLLTDAGYSVVILTRATAEEILYPTPESVRVRALGQHGPGSPSERLSEILYWIKEVANEEKIDILINHANYRDDELFMALGLSMIPIRTVYTIHNFCLRSMLDFNKRMVQYPTILSLYDAVAVLSPTDDLFWRLAGLTNTRVLPNPIDGVLTDESSAGDSGDPLTEVDILWMARLQEHTKAQSEAMHILSRVLDSRPLTKMRIIGPDADRGAAETLKKLAASLGVSESVEILPATDHPEEALRATKIVLCTSVVEGFPYSLVEAIAAHRPVVMYALPHLMIPDGNPSIVSTPWGRRDLCADAVVDLLDKGPELTDIATQGYKVMTGQYNDKELLVIYEALFESLTDPDNEEPVQGHQSSEWKMGSVLVDECLRLFGAMLDRVSSEQSVVRKQLEESRAEVKELKARLQSVSDAVRANTSSSLRDQVRRLARTSAGTTSPSVQQQGIWPLGQRRGLSWNAAVDSPFSDVAPEDRYYVSACWLLDQGLLPDWVDGAPFGAHSEARRKDVVEALWRLAGRPTSGNNLTTPDDELTYWWAHDHAMIGGLQMDKYQEWSTQVLTKSALAAFLYRAAGQPNVVPSETSPFSDLKVDHVHYPSVWWCSLHGIVTGLRTASGVVFQPNQPVQRCDMAEALFRLIMGPIVPPAQSVAVSPNRQ